MYDTAKCMIFAYIILVWPKISCPDNRGAHIFEVWIREVLLCVFLIMNLGSAIIALVFGGWSPYKHYVHPATVFDEDVSKVPCNRGHNSCFGNFFISTELVEANGGKVNWE